MKKNNLLSRVQKKLVSFILPCIIISALVVELRNATSIVLAVIFLAYFCTFQYRIIKLENTVSELWEIYLMSKPYNEEN